VGDFIGAAVVCIVACLGATWILHDLRFVPRRLGAAFLIGLSIASVELPTGTARFAGFLFPFIGGVVLWNLPWLREAYKKDQAEAARLRALRDEQETGAQTR